MKTIFLLGTARENSSRIKNKMTRRFGNTNLYNIYLNKFEEILKSNNPFDGIGMAINSDDKLLWNSSKSSQVSIIERNRDSVEGLRRRSEELHFLKDIESEYVMWINGCLPLLKVETIIDAAQYFKNNKEIKSLTVVKSKHNWYWEYNSHLAINNKDSTCVSTQGCEPLLETVHAFHIFKREQVLKKDSYWNLESNDPYLYIVKDDMEFVDIDSELDFMVAEILWKNKY